MTGKDLKEMRDRFSLSMASLAEKMGCSKQTIVNYEGGRSEIPRYFALACTAFCLGLPPYDGFKR